HVWRRQRRRRRLFFACVQRWQSLISSMIALAAAGWAWQYTQQQIQVAQRQLGLTQEQVRATQTQASIARSEALSARRSGLFSLLGDMRKIFNAFASEMPIEPPPEGSLRVMPIWLRGHHSGWQMRHADLNAFIAAIGQRPVTPAASAAVEFVERL